MNLFSHGARRRARPRATWRLSRCIGCIAAVAACESGKPPQGHAAPEQAVAAAKPVFIPGSSASESVAPFVKSELERARPDETTLVYVGAPWCEPCRHFHQAVERGDLDTAFPGLRLLEFDLDRDRDALERDGYSSQLIPLFAVPLPDGRASEQRMSGSIKGPGAVSQNIVPRLKELLATASR